MLTRPDTRSFSDREAPRIQALSPNLDLACFSLMKLRPARYMLDQAEARGEIGPGGMIAESTSGTFGLALAQLGRVRGYRVHLVSDPSIDKKLLGRLHRIGAVVDIVDTPAATGGFQRARLDRLADVLEANPEAYWPRQYENPDNPESYTAVADYLTGRLGQIDCLVGTIGSGGSMCGLARRLREHNPALHVIGVDVQNSVVFGQEDGPRALRGAGNSILPLNVDHTVFDQVHWIASAVGFAAARELEHQTTAYMGGTSGAAFLVARWWAEAHREQRVVAIGPDEGERYAETIFNDEFLASLPGFSLGTPASPVVVNDPASVEAPWTAFPWNRRRRDEVIGT